MVIFYFQYNHVLFWQYLYAVVIVERKVSLHHTSEVLHSFFLFVLLSAPSSRQKNESSKQMTQLNKLFYVESGKFLKSLQQDEQSKKFDTIWTAITNVSPISVQS